MSKANDAANKERRRTAEIAAARVNEMRPGLAAPPVGKPVEKKKGRKQSRGK